LTFHLGHFHSGDGKGIPPKQWPKQFRIFRSRSRNYLWNFAHIYWYSLEQPPNTETVATRMIPFFVGNPYKPLFVTVTECPMVPWCIYCPKKSPTGPTFHGPLKPEYLMARSQLRGPLVRSHSIFDGIVHHSNLALTSPGCELSGWLQPISLQKPLSLWLVLSGCHLSLRGEVCEQGT